MIHVEARENCHQTKRNLKIRMMKMIVLVGQLPLDQDQEENKKKIKSQW
jgi:hypothetical protein